jgi:hypothetical protein
VDAGDPGPETGPGGGDALRGDGLCRIVPGHCWVVSPG